MKLRLCMALPNRSMHDPRDSTGRKESTFPYRSGHLYGARLASPVSRPGLVRHRQAAPVAELIPVEDHENAVESGIDSTNYAFAALWGLARCVLLSTQGGALAVSLPARESVFSKSYEILFKGNRKWSALSSKGMCVEKLAGLMAKRHAAVYRSHEV